MQLGLRREYLRGPGDLTLGHVYYIASGLGAVYQVAYEGFSASGWHVFRCTGEPYARTLPPWQFLPRDVGVRVFRLELP